MMIAPGKKRSSRGRAERGGVEVIIAKASLSHPIKCWGRYRAAERARRTEARVIRQDQQNVRGTLGCCHGRGEVRFGFTGLTANDPSKSRLGRWEDHRTTQRWR